MLDRRTVALGLAAAAAGAHPAAGARPVTPQEMMGPFYPGHPLSDHDFDLTRIRGLTGQAQGEIIEIVGRVLRTDGTPVRHAAIEMWQANSGGKYRHPDDVNPAPIDPGFQGYARLSTGADGSFRLLTVKPGAYPPPIGLRAPHIHFDIRSDEFRLVTQMYFRGEPLNATDPLLSTMPARHQDPALVVAQGEDGMAGVRRFHWDAILLS
jgi:protocatechuate 3,4-dioxygenase beta subunit